MKKFILALVVIVSFSSAVSATTYYNQIGNTVFGSDGSSCSQIGSTVFCN